MTAGGTGWMILPTDTVGPVTLEVTEYGGLIARGETYVGPVSAYGIFATEQGARIVLEDRLAKAPKQNP